MTKPKTDTPAVPLRPFRQGSVENSLYVLMDLGVKFHKATEQALEVRTNLHSFRGPEQSIVRQAAEDAIKEAHALRQETDLLAFIEQHRTPVADIDLGPDPVALAEEAFATEQRKSKSLKESDTQAVHALSLALRDEVPTIEKAYSKYVAFTYDEEEVSIAAVKGLEGTADIAAPALEVLYLTAIANHGLDTQQRTRLREAWKARSSTMPTIEDIVSAMTSETYNSPGAVKARAAEALKTEADKQRREEVAVAARYRSELLTGPKDSDDNDPKEVK